MTIISSHNPNKITVGMTCVDQTDGHRVIVDSVIDSKYVEVGVWCGDHFSYEGDRIRMDDLAPFAA